MGDVKMRRENIRYEARGKSFEIECPSGFSGIEAVDGSYVETDDSVAYRIRALTTLGISILRTLEGGE